MKVLFDKIMEFVLKQLNVVMTKVVAALPSSLRNKFGDLKEKLNEMILGMYNQMIAGAGDQLVSALMDTLQPAKREAEARQIAEVKEQDTASSKGSDGEFKTAPKVPMCYAESIASTVISKNKDKIEKQIKMLSLI